MELIRVIEKARNGGEWFTNSIKLVLFSFQCAPEKLMVNYLI